MIKLTDTCQEGSTYAIKGIQFLDEDDTPVIPNTNPTWTMEGADGTEIDSGTLTASSSMDLVLSGTQTTITSSELASSRVSNVYNKKVFYVTRYVTIESTVNSTLGNNLPVTQAFYFEIENIGNIE